MRVVAGVARYIAILEMARVFCEADITEYVVVIVTTETKRIYSGAFARIVRGDVPTNQQIRPTGTVRPVGTAAISGGGNIAVVTIDTGNDGAGWNRQAGYVGIDGRPQHRVERWIAGIELERNIRLIVYPRRWRRGFTGTVRMAPETKLIHLGNRIDFAETGRIDAS